jgi:hypothetical protein
MKTYEFGIIYTKEPSPISVGVKPIKFTEEKA